MTLQSIPLKFWPVTVRFGRLVGSSETSVPVYQTTRCPIPDDCNINTHRHVKLRFYIRSIYCICLLFSGFVAGDCAGHLVVSSGLSVCTPVRVPDLPPRFEPWNSILYSAHNIDVAAWSLGQLGSSDQIVPGLILTLLTQYCSGIKIEKNDSMK